MKKRYLIYTVLFVLIAVLRFGASQVSAETLTYNDTDAKTLDTAGNTYVIKGSYPEQHVNSGGFTVEENSSSENSPITVILDNVCVSQKDKSPKISYIKIEKGNYVIVKLRGKNFIEAWSHDEIGSNDGMAGIHVSSGSTVKVTDENGDGKTDGFLEVHGGGGKYGGAGIGTRYNEDTGTVIIAGGEIKAYGGYSAAGIGSGRDGKAKDIRITGGNIYAEGGRYGAGIGAGDNVGTGTGGNLVDLTITGGKIEAQGGEGAAGIGCSEGGYCEGKILIDIDGHASNFDILTTGGKNGAGIGGGDSHDVTGDIEIRGTGQIRAYGGRNGAGIGGGNDAGSGKITIIGDTIEDESKRYGEKGEAPEGSRGLKITAVSSVDREADDEGNYNYDNDAAAIGSGKATGGDIVLQNAYIEAKSDCQGANIGGGGYHTTIGGTLSNITIDNCEIHAENDEQKDYIHPTSTNKISPGIGAGYGGSVNTITITNTKYVGGGIGGAPCDINYIGLNTVKSITIKNSDINANWDELSTSKFTGTTIDPNAEPIAHGAAGIGSGQYGSIDSITIEDSNVKTGGFGSGAGIGGGGAGGNGFTALNLKKWDVGDVGTIKITGSSVDAESGCAGFKDHEPIVIYDGHVFVSIDFPMNCGGGAGIGSGSASGVGTVDISDCEYIRAVGKRGSGIGGGCGTGEFKSGYADYIFLENIDKLEAKGGDQCTGIGTGGGVGIEDEYSCMLGEIYIKNCSDLTAVGGEGGAGIGCGEGSAYSSRIPTKGDKTISIYDSNITASGGLMGAGIGGGLEERSYFERIGGENPPILIKGNCRIDAYGGGNKFYEDDAKGSHGGGAGIGGGSCGACTEIEIDVTEDYENATRGTYEHPEKSKYYVRAAGGDGAAGIGCGGATWQPRNGDKNNADGDTITIKKGAVFARGGNTQLSADNPFYPDDWKFHMGAGAGIGGGSAESMVKHINIEGGFIVAEAGEQENENDKADDIGAGGDFSKNNDGNHRKSKYLKITDGTVLADNFGEFTEQCRISGGSVRTAIDGATEGDSKSSTKVYLTKALFPKNIKNEKVDGFSTSKSYGAKHIYADENGKVYLYLRENGSPEDHSQWADMEVNTDYAGKNKWHYTGYTTDTHTGILKIEGNEITFKDPGDVKAGDDFTLELDDDEIAQGSVWSNFRAKGSASIKKVINDTSKGVKLKMHANKVGSYSVQASTSYTPDGDYYWGSTALFTGNAGKSTPSIVFNEDPSKIYDTLPAVCPSITTESTGEVTYEFYTDEACSKKTGTSDGASESGGAPVNAGKYWVKASVAETDMFDSASGVFGFVIHKAQTSVDVSITHEHSDGRVLAVVKGLCEADGEVTFTIENTDDDRCPMSMTSAVTDQDGLYAAVCDFDMRSSGSYIVEAAYKSSNGNYTVSVGTATADKNEYNRTIEGQRYYGKKYGDEPFNLQLSVSDTVSGAYNYTVDYAVVSDRYRDNYSLEPAVEVETDGTVTIRHAGLSVIKATFRSLPGTTGFADTDAYIVVNVAPADLTVTPYAFRKGMSDSEDAAADSAVYGNLNSLDYSLSYSGFVNSDIESTFEAGLIGSIEPEPIPETAAVSETPYEIGVRYTGEEVTINGEKKKVFLSRDYNINVDSGKYPVKVNKASLGIQIDDARGIYGGEEPEYTWHILENTIHYDGLAPWDTEDAVFTEAPAIGLNPDARVTEYKKFKAGLHEYCITILSLGKSANYRTIFIPGSLTVDPADISDSSRFDVLAEDTVYNGKAQKQKVTVIDNAFSSGNDPAAGGASGSGLELTEGKDFDAAYPDDGEMTDAGSVTAEISGKKNYTGTTGVSYKIRPASAAFETESAEKEYDGKALTAGGNISGLVNGETASLDITGTQTEPGQSKNNAKINWNGTAKADNYTVRRKLGTLTVTAPDTVYTCVSGDKAEWTHGSSDSLSFTFKRNWHDDLTFGHFTGIKIDDSEVSKDAYSAAPGSVAVTLSPAYLDTLDEGKHKLSAAFDDAEAPEVTFTVAEKKETVDPVDPTDPDKPDNAADPDDDDDSSGGSGNNDHRSKGARTGDDSQAAYWLMLLIASAGALAAMIIRKAMKR